MQTEYEGTKKPAATREGVKPGIDKQARPFPHPVFGETVACIT